MNIFRKIKLTRHVCDLLDIVHSPSLYSEFPRKSKRTRFLENLEWLLKYHNANRYYNLWGMDIVGVVSDDFFSLDYLQKTRDIMNHERGSGKMRYNYGITALDKFILYSLLHSADISMPQTMAISLHGHLYALDSCNMRGKLFTEQMVSDLFYSDNTYFCKIVTSIQGRLVRKVTSLQEFKALCEEWQNQVFIVQCAVKQHEKISAIYAGAINTIRIVTANYGNHYGLLGAFFRCGSKSTGYVDNLHRGGGLVPIDENGKLSKYALGFGQTQKAMTAHPDSGFVFDGFELPYYREAVEMTCKAHQYFYGLCSIGWDVAISEDGPTILECNVLWGAEFLQSKDIRLKENWNRCCRAYGLKER